MLLIKCTQAITCTLLLTEIAAANDTNHEGVIAKAQADAALHSHIATVESPTPIDPCTIAICVDPIAIVKNGEIKKP